MEPSKAKIWLDQASLKVAHATAENGFKHPNKAKKSIKTAIDCLQGAYAALDGSDPDYLPPPQ